MNVLILVASTKAKCQKGPHQVVCCTVSTIVTIDDNGEFSRFTDPQLIALRSKIIGTEEAFAALEDHPRSFTVPQSSSKPFSSYTDLACAS